MSTLSIDAHRHLVQASLRDDGGVGQPLVALQRHELVELAEALARILKRCRTFAKVLEVHLLELVHTLEAIADTLEGVAADGLHLGVEHAYCLHKHTLHCLGNGLRVLHMGS